MEQFEEQLHQDLHQFLQSMKEVDERLPECPDVEDKWEEIAKAYIPDGIREFNDFPSASLGWIISEWPSLSSGMPNGRSTRRLTTSMPTCETRGVTMQWTNISVKMSFCCKVLTTPFWRKSPASVLHEYIMLFVTRT